MTLLVRGVPRLGECPPCKEPPLRKLGEQCSVTFPKPGVPLIDIWLQLIDNRWRRIDFVGNFTQDSPVHDCDGHGTHVAATAVGRNVGVAKEANVVAVRVLDCEVQ